MPDIFHNFPINAPAQKVFDAVSTAEGLDRWWTKTCEATPGEGSGYNLGFGPGYSWRAVASQWQPNAGFELKLVDADQDWLGTRIGFQLSEKDGVTEVRFHHLGWPEANEHYQISCFCWAMYLRLLKRYVELGETVAYEDRLDA